MYRLQHRKKQTVWYEVIAKNPGIIYDQFLSLSKLIQPFHAVMWNS